MSMGLQMSAESRVLYVKASGEFSVEEAERTFMELLRTVAHHKIDKIFFDGRGVEGHPEAMERFYLGEFEATEVIDLFLRNLHFLHFAYVLREPGD
jgi:hypothetical protein